MSNICLENLIAWAIDLPDRREQRPMIQTLTIAQRLEQLESQVNKLNDALIAIGEQQDSILENDKKLFEIHAHNEKYLNQVHDEYLEIRSLLEKSHG